MPTFRATPPENEPNQVHPTNPMTLGAHASIDRRGLGSRESWMTGVITVWGTTRATALSRRTMILNGLRRISSSLVEGHPEIGEGEESDDSSPSAPSPLQPLLEEVVAHLEMSASTPADVTLLVRLRNALSPTTEPPVIVPPPAPTDEMTRLVEAIRRSVGEVRFEPDTPS
jgi:hypothetical protein